MRRVLQVASATRRFDAHLYAFPGNGTSTTRATTPRPPSPSDVNEQSNAGRHNTTTVIMVHGDPTTRGTPTSPVMCTIKEWCENNKVSHVTYRLEGADAEAPALHKNDLSNDVADLVAVVTAVQQNDRAVENIAFIGHEYGAVIAGVALERFPLVVSGYLALSFPFARLRHLCYDDDETVKSVTESMWCPGRVHRVFVSGTAEAGFADGRVEGAWQGWRRRFGVLASYSAST
eukprot:PhM_4_TR10914/c0_g1_i3/m.44097